MRFYGAFAIMAIVLIIGNYVGRLINKNRIEEAKLKGEYYSKSDQT